VRFGITCCVVVRKTEVAESPLAGLTLGHRQNLRALSDITSYGDRNQQMPLLVTVILSRIDLMYNVSTIVVSVSSLPRQRRVPASAVSFLVGVIGIGRKAGNFRIPEIGKGRKLKIIYLFKTFLFFFVWETNGVFGWKNLSVLPPASHPLA
jgi:hypothetical protein